MKHSLSFFDSKVLNVWISSETLFSCLIYFLSLIRYEISAPILDVCISDETLRIILAYEILHTNM